MSSIIAPPKTPLERAPDAAVKSFKRSADVREQRTFFEILFGWMFK